MTEKTTAPPRAQVAAGGSATNNAEEAPAPKASNWSDPITLAEPIVRGDTEIASIRLRKPKAGELRGLSLQDVITTDIVALLTLIPRISEPPLTQPEADGLDPADLTECGGAIRGFFMTGAERQMLEAMIAEQRPRS